MKTREEIDKFYAATPKHIKELLNVCPAIHNLYHAAIHNNSTTEEMLLSMVVFWRTRAKNLEEEDYQRKMRSRTPPTMVVRNGKLKP
jgi:hypothetical protein